MQEYYIYRDHEGNQYCKGDLGEGYGIYEKLAYAKNREWIFSFRQKWCLSNKNETEIDESAVNVGHFISVQSLDLEGNIPTDLHNVLILARKAECNWLCLDADGKIVPYIPMYERNERKLEKELLCSFLFFMHTCKE